MSEIPTPVSESTAIEWKRKEGSTVSEKAVSSISAGDIVYNLNNSGLVEAIGGITRIAVIGIALYDAASGKRATVARGQLRARWDGTGTVGLGTAVATSTTSSGMWEPIGSLSGGGSGLLAIGRYLGVGGDPAAPAAANSGTLLIVEVD